MTETERLASENERLRADIVKLRDEAAIGRSVQCALNSITTVLMVYGGLGNAIDMAVKRALDARLKSDKPV